MPILDRGAVPMHLIYRGTQAEEGVPPPRCGGGTGDNVPLVLEVWHEGNGKRRRGDKWHSSQKRRLSARPSLGGCSRPRNHPCSWLDTMDKAPELKQGGEPAHLHHWLSQSHQQ